MILYHIRYEESTPSKSQNFLDTTVSISYKNTILLQLHSKDTASGAYLHPFSTHPWRAITATPYSQLLRIQRIPSTKYILKRHVRRMFINFHNMSYNSISFNRTFRKILKLDKQAIT